MTLFNEQHGGHLGREAHPTAAAVPAPVILDRGHLYATSDLVAAIRAAARSRRFAMKTAQKITLSLESYIRRNSTDWHPGMDEKNRARIKREVQAIIKAAREDENHPDYREVEAADLAREPSLALKRDREGKMIALAKHLPVYPWCKAIPGAGEIGLALIVAESGIVSTNKNLPGNNGNYPNVGKFWNRLGYAPFKGHAGSTWKRDSWRPRALTKEEWIENPFDGERYGQLYAISEALRQYQFKTLDDDTRVPIGPYGEEYAARRAKTAITHPDWTKAHSYKDGLRVMMKAFLRDLWVEWERTG